MASARASLVRSYPGRGIPRALAGWEDYLETVETTTRAGELPDYTFLWWDVRPHPGSAPSRCARWTPRRRWPTSRRSRRSCTASRAPRPSARLSARIRPPRRSRGRASAPRATGSTRRSRSTARRSRCATSPAPPSSGPAPHARELGAEDALEGIERILREGGGADRQRAAHAEGGLDAVCAALVDATAG